MSQAQPKNKIDFTVEKDGKTVELAVIRPSVKVQQDAQIYYSKMFKIFLEGGAMLNAALASHVKTQNIWNDDRQKQFTEIVKRINDNEEIVKRRVKGVSLKKATEAAIQMRRDRAAFADLTRPRAELEGNTVEGQADNARFNFLVSACTVYADDKKPYFRDVDDYLSRENDPATVPAYNHFATLYHGSNPDEAKSYPENEFLLKYRLCNEKLHLIKVIDGKEHLVDTEGRLVDERNRLVNVKGELVDIDGRLVDEEGNRLDQETFAFLDDDGKEIAEPDAKEVPALATPSEPVVNKPLDVVVVQAPPSLPENATEVAEVKAVPPTE